MMKLLAIFSAAAAMVLLVSCGSEPEKPAILTITGVNGMRVTANGRTFSKNPLRLKLKAGEYFFRCSAPGYRECFVPATLKSGEKKEIKVPFRKAPCSVLIESRPAGAEFTMNGRKCGTTPLTVSGLGPGEYSGVLSMPGYADQSISWQIDSERPRRLWAALRYNSGEIFIESVTPDTRIFIDGVEAGIAPVRLSRTEGKYLIRAESPGCIPEEQTVTLKRESKRNIRFALKGKPAVLTVESVPGGAEVFINGEKRGVTPCKLENMPSGNYLLRLALPLHDPAEREISLVAGSSETVKIDLESGVGHCRLNLKPAGVRLTLDGKPLGVVKIDPDDRRSTLPVILRDLTPGEHTIEMYHELAIPMRRKVKFTVRKGQETYVTEKMWVADCEIVYNNGEMRRGVLCFENNRNIHFEFEPGIRIEIKRSLLRSIRRLGGE